jgi:tetratricopeptide (TPR) repeat protein
MKKTRFLILAFLMLVFFFTEAQKTLVYAHEDADFHEALELFNNEKFTVAQRKFKKIYDRIEAPHSEIKMNTEYYVALCALELFNKDAEYLFIKFIDHHPQSPKVRVARYQLGKYNYRKRRWSTTIKWFEQVDENDLEPDELAEFHFKYGYSLFKKKKKEEAKKRFYITKNSEGDYKTPASFYYAHLEYEAGQYETAYKEFKALEDDEAFGPVVPYYITQILYLQKKYEDLIIFGSLFLDSASTKRAPEIARLVGEGYYNVGDYVKSAEYFEVFMEKSSDIDTLAYYQLGYSYYKNGDYGKALKSFKESADNQTEVGQLSLYYIGDCYIKVGNKKAARSAFRFASKNDHSLHITENALFNYAKLSFELDIDPYHESIIALQKFINKYPKSANVNKARKYLLNVYLNTKNYQMAIDALEKIEDKNMDLKYAYQKIAYYRGIQVFNNVKLKLGSNKKDVSNYLKSIYFFNKSLKFPEDQEVVSLSYYWKAEALYRLGKYQAAINTYNKFRKSPSSIILKEYKDVDYQVGYAYLRLGDYGPAITSFRTFETKVKGAKSMKLNDAFLRIGDSYLILSNNLKSAARKNELIHATNYYNKAIGLGLKEVDYAYYQLGQSYKLLNKYELVVEAYENLIFHDSTSNWIIDAKFNAGFVYFEHLERYDLASKYFNDIVNNHTKDLGLVQQSLNHIGNIKKIEGDIEGALASFEKSVLLDPRTKYAGEALGSHELISTYKLKDVSRYNTFRGITGLPAVSEGKNDSLNYESAKASYVELDYPKSIVNFNSYVDQFPQGVFIHSANFMLAESYFRRGDKDLSLPFYEKVIEAPFGENTAIALSRSAAINMDSKNYQKAIARFLLLEENAKFDDYKNSAQVGLMTAYNEIEEHENTGKYAKLVEKNTIDNNTIKYQASVLYGNSLLKAFKLDTALLAYERTVAGTQKIMAAEAQYNIAYIYFVQQKYSESEAAISKLLQELSVYQDWASRGFILLSDIYVKRGDVLQAKFALNTVIANHEGKGIVDFAKKKLQELEDIEKAKLVEKEEEKFDVNIGGDSEENNKLFEEDQEIEIPALDTSSIDTIIPVVVPTDSTITK